MTIPGGCTKCIQAPDMCWNKPLKARMTELLDQLVIEGVHQFTEMQKYEVPFQEKNN